MSLRAMSCGILVACAVGSMLSAGPLDPPPGPVSSSYRTIDEVHPGRIITQKDIPFTITQPGNYYLATNLYPSGFGDDMVTVLSSDVTIDLCGYTMYGSSEVALADSAIHIVQPAGNVTVRNGTIRECEGHGVSTSENGGAGYFFKDLKVISNGESGIFLPFESGHAIDCFAQDNGGTGIAIGQIVARNCIIIGNDNGGIIAFSGVVQSNTVEFNGVANITLGTGVNVDNHAP